MTPNDLLAKVVDEMEANHGAVSDVLGAKQGNWRWELVQARRGLSRIVGELSGLLDDAEARCSRDRDRAREALLKFRSEVATHQTSFAAASLQPPPEQYDASARRVRDGQAALCDVIRRTYGLSAPLPMRPRETRPGS